MLESTRVLLEKHPMPWSTMLETGSINMVSSNHNLMKTVLIDANGTEIKLDSNNVTAIAEITKLLTKGQRRKLGEKSTSLFTLKNTTNGQYYWRCGSLVRAKTWYTRQNAQKEATRQNGYNRGEGTWVVVEIDMQEKKAKPV